MLWEIREKQTRQIAAIKCMPMTKKINTFCETVKFIPTLWKTLVQKLSSILKLD